MFKNLSNKIANSIRKIINVGKLTESDIKDTLNSIRISLLEGDVALPVVQDFVNQVKKNIVGRDINTHLTPGQTLVKAMHTALVKIMIDDGCSNELDLCTQNPAIILMVGTQGSGKTTTTGKLANFLSTKKNKRVLVSSIDLYRPAGIDQLKILINDIICVDYFDNKIINDSCEIVQKAIVYAKSKNYDVLLIDTAGCSDTDNLQLSELVRVYNIAQPIEVLFIVDAMMGQVSINYSKIFSEKLPLTGVILTKLDGDTRGGAALSVKYLIGKPIKFIGVGEKIGELERFYPNRIANRILGMGDILSLIESVENTVDFANKKEKYFNNNNTDFNLCDFLIYIKQVKNMGGVDKIINKLPDVIVPSDKVKSCLNNNMFVRMEAIINSMTIKERINPDIIIGSRKKRIARGSGVNIQDVNTLLTQFNRVRVVMNQLRKSGMLNMARTLKNRISSIFMTR